MSVLGRVDRVMGAFGLAPKAAASRRRGPDLPGWWGTIGEQGAWGEGIPDPSIYANQAQRYVTSPAFYAGVNRIAEAGATTRFVVRAGLADDAPEIPDHEFLALLRRPAPEMEWLSLDRFTLIESTLASLAITGNAYLYLGGRPSPTVPPTMLLPLRPDRLAPVADKLHGVAGYTYTIGYTEWPLSVADVLHIRRFNPLNDFVGLSQVEPANYALATDLAAQKHNWATFKNSARLSVVLESDQANVTKDDRDLMEQFWRDTYTGDPEKAHQVAFLWSGFKARDLGMNLRDAEYVEGRKRNLLDTLMVLGVHPGLLMAEDVNLANAKTAEYLFAKYTLTPLLTRIVNRFNAEILPLYGEGHTLHAVDVVPRDELYESQIAQARAVAVVQLVNALGSVEGVAEAKRQNLLSAEAQAADWTAAVPGAPHTAETTPAEAAAIIEAAARTLAQGS